MKILIEVTTYSDAITVSAAMKELAKMILESSERELKNGVNMSGELTQVTIEHIF